MIIFLPQIQIIPGGPQIRAQINHKLPCELSRWFRNHPGKSLEKQPHCNAEELQICVEGGAWVAWDGRQALTNLRQKIRTVLVYRAHGFDGDGNEIVSLPHSSVLWIFRSEASSAAAQLTADVTGKCDIANVSGIVKSQVIVFPALPRNQHASVYTLTVSLPSRI